jgi:hypothetical protein
MTVAASVNTASTNAAARVPKPAIKARPPSTSTPIAIIAPSVGSGRPLEAI